MIIDGIWNKVKFVRGFVYDENMKILVIENGADKLGLRRVLIRHDAHMVSWEEFGASDVVGIDVVIVAGNGKYGVAGYRSLFGRERELVGQWRGPLLGAGRWGFEMVVEVFGGKLVEVERSERGKLKIEMGKHPVFEGMAQMEVEMEAQAGIKKLPTVMQGLAESKESVEVIKHRTRPVYGVRFEPWKARSVGEKLVSNWLKLAAEILKDGVDARGY